MTKKRIWSVLIMGATLGFVPWLMPKSGCVNQEATMKSKHSTGGISAVFAFLTLAVAALIPVSTSAAPIPVSSCQTLDSPGVYVLTADLTAVDATCIEITASDVKLDLAGHMISCTGSGFAGSCQVPEFGPHGVVVAPGLTGVVVTGPGVITGFDNGVVIFDSDVLVKGLTVTGPACDPVDCTRPISNGIIAIGQSGVHLLRNDVSGHLWGFRLIAQCPGGHTACVVNGNAVRHNDFFGIDLQDSTGYTVTRNVVRSNGCSGIACLEPGTSGGIGLAAVVETTDNLVINNDASDNIGWGIHTFLGANGNTFVNNTARGNTVSDLDGFPGTTNIWHDNNRCHTESGDVPPSVCNPGE